MLTLSKSPTSIQSFKGKLFTTSEGCSIYSFVSSILFVPILDHEAQKLLRIAMTSLGQFNSAKRSASGNLSNSSDDELDDQIKNVTIPKTFSTLRTNCSSDVEADSTSNFNKIPSSPGLLWRIVLFCSYWYCVIILLFPGCQQHDSFWHTCVHHFQNINNGTPESYSNIFYVT